MKNFKNYLINLILTLFLFFCYILIIFYAGLINAHGKDLDLWTLFALMIIIHLTINLALITKPRLNSLKKILASCIYIVVLYCSIVVFYWFH